MESKHRVLSIPSRPMASVLDQCKFYHERNKSTYVLEHIRRFGKYMDRRRAESSSDVKQIVSCAIVCNYNKILCIRRTKKSDRETLKLRWTVMVGGHVDELDSGSDSPILSCLIRELREELGVTPVEKPELLGIVFDPATPVGRLHIGIIHMARIDADQIEVRSFQDNSEFVNARKNNTYTLMNYKDLVVLAGNFDPWSTLFLRSKVAATILNCSYPVIPDDELDLHWKLGK